MARDGATYSSRYVAEADDGVSAVFWDETGEFGMGGGAAGVGAAAGGPIGPTAT